MLTVQNLHLKSPRKKKLNIGRSNEFVVCVYVAVVRKEQKGKKNEKEKKNCGPKKVPALIFFVFEWRSNQ